MVTINFYSYKGGVGRTMLTVQIARLLAALGRKVVVVDFDFDAPGVFSALGGVTQEGEREVKRGLFDLAQRFTGNPTFDGEREFKINLPAMLNGCCDKTTDERSVADGPYLLKMPLGFGAEGQGEISVLPCGRISEYYWRELYSRDWMEFLIAESSERRSFIRMFRDFIKPALKGLGYEYLLIDSRAGMSRYSKAAKDVSDRQVVMFAPNDEAKYALEKVILPELVESQRSKSPELEKVFLVISRVPPELEKEKEEVCKKFETIIKNKLKELCEKRGGDLENDKVLKELLRSGSNDASNEFSESCKAGNIFRIHSDIDSQLDPRKREFKNMDSAEVETVQMNHDILMIMGKLFSSKELGISPNNQEYASVDAIWNALFPDTKKFDVNHKYKLFIINRTLGAMLNPGDFARNIALKDVTFIKILNGLYDAFGNLFGNEHPKVRDEKSSERVRDGLYNAGYNAGEAFGSSLVIMMRNNHKGKFLDDKAKLEIWCEFDEDAGFGVLKYKSDIAVMVRDKNGKLVAKRDDDGVPVVSKEGIQVSELFLDNKGATRGRDYRSFFVGYAEGVMNQLNLDCTYKTYDIDGVEIRYDGKE